MLPNFFAYTEDTTAPIRFTECLAAEVNGQSVRSSPCVLAQCVR